jgi:small-conductance mechanosensitive channel
LLGAALLALLITLYTTRAEMEQLRYLRSHTGIMSGLVDQQPWQTATTLAALAKSSEEVDYAREAEHLAAHEVDDAFASALRQAGLESRSLTGDAAETSHQVDQLKATVKGDQAQVDTLTAQWKAAGTVETEGDDLAVAQAQLGLDQGELTDATGDLQRESGDQRPRIQQELGAWQATEKRGDGITRENALAAAKKYGTLWRRADAWFEGRSRAGLLAAASAHATEQAAQLGAQHNSMEQQNNQAQAAMAASAGKARVKLLNTMGSRRMVMSIFDDRQETDQQLARVYSSWEQQVWMQHGIVTHLLLQSIAWVLAILLAAVLGANLGRRLLARMGPDTRRVRTLDTILLLALQVVAGLAILLVVFGVPQNISTILGLTTAGLTVVFQDFILAFFGWFVLMGRNGMRVCDWVEIDSVGGEVAEIGLFRTSLLETGNWTSQGHPTGRRVTFNNSFAIRGQYFNFSTHGQWMWDQIKFTLADAAHAPQVIQQVQTLVEEKTAQDTGQAEAEWQNATRQNGLSQFSAKPSVELRPASAGVDIVVRFVTRASQRFDLRSRLYEALLPLLDPQKTEAQSPGEPEA